ncbi:glycoside hydrolase superfamily [Echria macrotheca]|uniref:Glycoside hydrolase superfamily n=1 Tax=Echria macrotheca TaxID=438768 RepID=A0AAJ0B2V9_9PEZI|nr:glycoside hydrolase superfamily [Echria macrotheca]
MADVQSQPTAPAATAKPQEGRVNLAIAPSSITMPPQGTVADRIRSRLGLDTFSPVNQNGSFEFDRVIKSGYVHKRTSKTKAWRSIFLVLRPNTLSIYKSDKEEKLRHKIYLSELTAVTLLKDPKNKRPNVFGLPVIRRESFLSPGITDDPRRAVSDFERLNSSSPEPVPPLARPKVSTSGRRPSQLDSSGLSGAELASHSDFSDAEAHRARGVSLESFVQSPPSSHAQTRPGTGPVNASQVSGINIEHDPDRVIWQGWLGFLRSKGGVRQWKKSWAVLRPRNLILYKDESEYSVLFIIYMSSIVNVVDIDAMSRTRKHCMQIITDEKSYRFCAKDEDQLVQCLGAFKSLLAKRRELEAKAAAAAAAAAEALPRWIVDANGDRVKLRCVNWAGHMETNLPEGLHKQSFDYLASWIQKQGFNCIRLTYSIDHALHPDVLVSDAFAQGAKDAGVSADEMNSKVYAQALQKNPWIEGKTTRDVFGVLVDKLWAQGIMTILDNHVSKASWCCGLTDGNGWWDSAFGYNPWNSRFFSTTDWLAGLAAMAAWSRSHPGVVGMSLRNELRAFLLQDLNGRADWYNYIQQAGNLVHATNPNVLVIVGGAQSATDLTHIRTKMLDTSGWPAKHVWEMHAYSFTVTYPDPFQSCDIVKVQYGFWAGFVLEQNKPYTGPLLLSEFGVGMTGGDKDGLVDKDSRYLSCLASYMQNNDAEWAVWVLGGSYYVRDGKVDNEETWGVLGYDWADWRNAKFPGMLGDMWKVTQGPGKRRVR